MRERLAEHVEVDIRQHVLVTPVHGKKRRIEALQYVIRNRETQVTTVQVDFSASSDVQLVFPPKNRPQLTQNAPMIFDFIVYPMEQRVMVAVVKDGGERAFVRVQYEVKDIASVPQETIATERGRRDAALAQLITRAARTYNGLNVDLSRKSEAAVTRLCADINGFNRSKPDIFVDSAFPPSPASLWGKVTIFHVEDDDSWMELKISDTTSIDSSFQIRFTATPGEYVIAVNILPSTLQQEASSDKWTEASIKSNLQLLFDCLDADMDGLLTDQELLQFLRTVEEVDPVDSTVINSVLDRFASERQQDRDTFGLTSDDLRDVYQHISETFNTSTKSSGFHQHLWRDLLQVLAIEPGARFISRENLFQLVVVAHSDGTDLELMALPDL
ncbi:hypothetical protein Poli38472_000248 [Pythium oligandrum]|uniref:EF-hand domain-containing protein n=1 Tax=Pythium oligandrum TaxID=41045 RepID=A0A8K1CC35_PYTOL|nr:hypothetical protein Poli38472_000248 [Pythium oligandrum]|eukprot:TMW60206.1 hypothetical protein Poli38472_000248 [Pythium oligandrum]